jgi:hypothetical protein
MDVFSEGLETEVISAFSVTILLVTSSNSSWKGMAKPVNLDEWVFRLK